MIDLWMMLALLLLPLALLIAWPVVAKVRERKTRRAELNADGPEGTSQAALYREHLAEIEQSCADGAIDEAQYVSLKTELARKLLAEEQGGSYQLAQRRDGGRGLLFALAFAVPLVALGLYFYWGAHDDVALYRDIVASQSGASDMVVEARITQQLRKRVESHPDDLNSRYMLAQRLLVSNDIQGALAQYRYIVAKEPEAVNIRAELAQALFFANGSKITAEVIREVDLVLATQPSNTTALGLAGIAAFEREDYAAAKSHWQRALNQLTPGSNAAQALAAGVQRAEAALAKVGGEAVAESTSVASQSADEGASKAQTADENSIAVTVSLGDAVKYSPSTPVFVYARTAESPMPLAIVRLTAADLPARVVLDESRAMMPGRSLKTVDQVQVVARLAVGGNARPAPGDWQGEVKTLAKEDWSKPLSIVIDQQI
ncbi:c-type cytochrome biogenesis protein CcmI [Microbulbifer agarilyticus]|uniref:C-type cytochrome biogenesis protein CcmI n=1 Tax=Microbulbifer agarilyticus TaxID=260552 RepID=A0A1Q2M3P7_9GAMM|nr:c-type cytochrome biogenesis protein CcmI [Microbulbifer agarilyticus]AQQ67354.1 c-type cytochrome biogenesis protein CcmI [Microbulbifer agarilyticus]